MRNHPGEWLALIAEKLALRSVYLPEPAFEKTVFPSPVKNIVI